MTKYLLPGLLLAMGTPSHAIQYTGDQRLSFKVDRPAQDLTDGSVYLTKVRIHECDSSYVDYPVNATIDPVAGDSVVIAGGDLCGATWFWGNDMVLYGDDGDEFTILYQNDTTSNVFASPLVPTALQPYEVTEGSISGPGPRLILHVESEI
jgi:hypothetical protein